MMRSPVLNEISFSFSASKSKTAVAHGSSVVDKGNGFEKKEKEKKMISSDWTRWPTSADGIVLIFVVKLAG